MMMLDVCKVVCVIIVLGAFVAGAGTAQASTLVSGMPATSQTTMPANMLTVVHGRPDPLEHALAGTIANLSEFQSRTSFRQAEDFPVAFLNRTISRTFASTGVESIADTWGFPMPDATFQLACTPESFESTQQGVHGVTTVGAAWPQSETPSSAIPEPATLVLVSLGILTLLGLQRRRLG